MFLKLKTAVTLTNFKRKAMKSIIHLMLTSMAGVALLVACTKEIDSQVNLEPEDKSDKPLVEVRFQASNPNSEGTKTSMSATDGGYVLSWNAGDKIGATSLVFEEVEDEWGGLVPYTEVYPFETAEGGSTATFTGKLMADNTYHFFYPTQFRVPSMEGGGEMELNAAIPGDGKEVRESSGKVATRSSEGEGDPEEEYPEFEESRIDLINYLYEMDEEDGEWKEVYLEDDEIPAATTSVPSIQYPQAGSFDGYADIMVANNTIEVPLPESGTSTVVIEASPNFKRLVSFLKTSIKDQTNGWFAGQHIQSIYLYTENNYEDHLTLPNGYIDLLNNKLAYEYRTSSSVEARYTEDTWYTPSSDGSQSTYFVVLPGKIHALTAYGDSNTLVFGGETEDVRFRKEVALPEDIILEEGKVTSLSFKITQAQASRRPVVNAIDIDGEGAAFDIGGRTKEIAFTPCWEDDGKGFWRAEEIIKPELFSIASSNPSVATASIVMDDDGDYQTTYVEDTPFLAYYIRVSPVSKGTATITVSYGSISSSFTVSVEDPQIITFADPKVKEVALTLKEWDDGVDDYVNWDFNGDGEISINEAKDVTSIPSNAFSGNAEITSFNELATYFTNVQYIGSGAFSGCTNLSSITFPEGLYSIYSQAFDGCTSLEELNLPSSCNRLGDYAFKDCSSLTEVHLSANKSTSFGASVFAGCANVTNVTGMNASEDGRCIFYEEGKVYFFFPAGLESYKFPDTVKSFLYGYDSNTYEYQYTYALQLVYGDENSPLRELDFSDTGMTRYSSGTGSMIASSKVERVILPRKMTSFEDSSFYGNNLKDVVFTAQEVPAGGYYPFSSIGSIENFYVPFQSYDLYMERYGSYSNFTTRAKPDIKDVVCTGFYITADDVHGRESKTTIHWTYAYTGTRYDGESVTGQLTGTAVSEDFEQNTDSSPRTVTVSYTRLGETASGPITQAAWETEWVSAQPDGTQWREATSIKSVEGVPFAYNLYESDSNYAESITSGNANMWIKVEGYQHKTITFYVNSSGRSIYSYLWVMKPNKEPLEYMYSSDNAQDIIIKTYGRYGDQGGGGGPLGNKFSHYMEVTVPDVSDGDVIWVQFGKNDYSWDSMAGRGFVLMPLVQD